MIVKNEASVLPITLPTYRGLIDSFTIVDTGSVDGTQETAMELLGDLPGDVHNVEWTDFAAARTKALELAQGTADWLFMPDADMTCETHPDLKQWLDTDPVPEVDVWRVEITEGNQVWKRPALMRGDQDWRYEFPVHEYLDTTGRNANMTILGLTLRHGLRQKSSDRFNDWAEILKPLAEQGEPRALFYLAECYRFAGRTEEALAVYDIRAEVAGGYDEEAWYSAYIAGKLRGDVGALIEAWEKRPWRHEPLTAAARIVAAGGPSTDALFLEPSP